MSVTTEVTLGAGQPASGTYSWLPLGGNGFTSPLAAYLLNGVAIAGDASGGSAQITVNMDDRYANLVSVIQQTVSVVAADVEMRFTLQHGEHAGNMSLSAHSAPNNFNSVDQAARSSWSPPPFFGADALVSRCANTNGDTYALSGVVYLFNKRAAEITPLSVLLASLPRTQAIV